MQDFSSFSSLSTPPVSHLIKEPSSGKQWNDLGSRGKTSTCFTLVLFIDHCPFINHQLHILSSIAFQWPVFLDIKEATQKEEAPDCGAEYATLLLQSQAGVSEVNWVETEGFVGPHLMPNLVKLWCSTCCRDWSYGERSNKEAPLVIW